jgi:hypothetical protein
MQRWETNFSFLEFRSISIKSLNNSKKFRKIKYLVAHPWFYAKLPQRRRKGYSFNMASEKDSFLRFGTKSKSSWVVGAFSCLVERFNFDYVMESKDSHSWPLLSSLFFPSIKLDIMQYPQPYRIPNENNSLVLFSHKTTAVAANYEIVDIHKIRELSS